MNAAVAIKHLGGWTLWEGTDPEGFPAWSLTSDFNGTMVEPRSVHYLSKREALKQLRQYVEAGRKERSL